MRNAAEMNAGTGQSGRRGDGRAGAREMLMLSVSFREQWCCTIKWERGSPSILCPQKQGSYEKEENALPLFSSRLRARQLTFIWCECWGCQLIEFYISSITTTFEKIGIAPGESDSSRCAPPTLHLIHYSAQSLQEISSLILFYCWELFCELNRH